MFQSQSQSPTMGPNWPLTTDYCPMVRAWLLSRDHRTVCWPWSGVVSTFMESLTPDPEVLVVLLCYS